jgi:hypothetical protein
MRYLNYLDHPITPADSAFFLSHLNGIPGQAIYAANLIDAVGITEAKGYIADIQEFDYLSVLAILEYLNEDSLCIQMLIAVSKFPIISPELIYRIFGEKESVYKAIQKLFDLGIFYNTSSTHEYLKLNNSISDYIGRSKLELEESYNANLKAMVRESISKPLTLDQDSDYSEFLFSIGNMIRDSRDIPPRYFIPSFILTAIVQEYYDRGYDVAISLARKMLDSTKKFDPQILRETWYWLCQASKEAFIKNRLNFLSLCWVNTSITLRTTRRQRRITSKRSCA